MGKKNQTPQLLTYYAPHRCAAEDTQDLYLGFSEIKPIVSVINKLQITQADIIKGKFTTAEELAVLQGSLSLHLKELERIILEDTLNQIPQKDRKLRGNQ